MMRPPETTSRPGVRRSAAGQGWFSSVAVALALALVHAPLSAQSSGMDGGTFYQLCKTEADRPYDRCEAYLEGVAGMLAAFGNGGHPGGICGSRYGSGELGPIYRKWIERNRKLWTLPRGAGAALALRDRWPCQF